MLGFAGCDTKPKSATAKSTAAKVEMVPHESELATISLSPDAETRLGITTVLVERSTVSPHRVFGGEVMIPTGRSIIVSAPVSGIVSSVSDLKFPIPGVKVQGAEAVLMLAPLLSPERDVPTPAEHFQMAGARATLMAAQVTAQGDMDRSQAEVEAAKIAVSRTQKLFADRAGSQRAVDDAQALLNISSSVFAAASDRHKQLATLLGTLEGKSKEETATTLTIRAPMEGFIRNVSVSNGQQVVSGATLFEVFDRHLVWVRVPVFVDLLPAIQRAAQGKVVSLDGKPLVKTSNETLTVTAASPIDAPPTADAGTSSADLYFSVDNERLELRPGQRVGIELALNGDDEAIVVPAAAILYDIYGGTWLYIETAEHRFERRRTIVRWFDGDKAILKSGPNVGAKVVVNGAAELFGTEFGGGK